MCLLAAENELGKFTCSSVYWSVVFGLEKSHIRCVCGSCDAQWLKFGTENACTVGQILMTAIFFVLYGAYAVADILALPCD